METIQISGIEETLLKRDIEIAEKNEEIKQHLADIKKRDKRIAELDAALKLNKAVLDQVMDENNRLKDRICHC